MRVRQQFSAMHTQTFGDTGKRLECFGVRAGDHGLCGQLHECRQQGKAPAGIEVNRRFVQQQYRCEAPSGGDQRWHGGV